MAGFEIPTEMSPNRPLLFEEEYEALAAIADEVDWRFASMLTLAHETGHRIGAIRELRWADIDLEAGLIRWRRLNDKIGMEHYTPMTPPIIEALVLAREHNPGIGDAPGVSEPRARPWPSVA